MPEAAQSVKSAPGKLFVIDDNPTNLDLLVQMLRCKGHTVHPVLSGRLALRAIEINPPDLILVDVAMPDMDGYEFCRQLKRNEKLRSIPVLFISALTETFDKVKAFDAGGVDYIIKPFQIEEVEARIQAHLRLSRSEELSILKERKRIAQEIHDGIAQDLASLRMRVDYWKCLLEQSPHDLNEEFNFWQKQLDEDILEVRRSIFALRPPALDEIGFFPAISSHIKQFGNLNHLTIYLSLPDSLPNLAKDLEHSLYRIIQECLNNIAKHSKANKVWISFRNDAEKNILVQIQDDGIGFDVHSLKNARSEGHLGISQMKDRVLEYKGKFKISSKINQGTLIQISIPLID
jgi:two-component system, sensor histidine kinase and response regulator